MFIESRNKKSVVSLVSLATFGLALVITSANLSPASAAAPVSVSGAWSVSDLVSSVAAELPWPVAALTHAKQVVHSQVATLESELKKLQDAGASVVEVRLQNPDTSNPLNHYLPAAQQLRKFKLTGKDAWGSTVRSTAYLPDSAGVQGLDALLTHLNADRCSTGGFNIFNFSSYFIPKCEIVAPSAGQLLKYGLLTQLAYVGKDLYQQRISQLNSIVSNNLAFKVAGGSIMVPGLAKFWTGVTSIPLVSTQNTARYRITVKPNNAGFEFVEQKPDVTQLAKSAVWSNQTGEFFNRI